MQATRRHAALLTLATLAALGLAARPAAAQTEYDSQSGFLSAVEASPSTDAFTTLTFNGLGENAQHYTAYGDSFTDGGVTFTTPSGSEVDVTSPSYTSAYDYGTGDTLGAFNDTTDANAPLTALLPADTSAVGFDLGDFYGSPFTVTLTPVSGAATAYTVTGGQPASQGGRGFNFVGFTSDTPLASVTFSGPAALATGAVFDNFTYATASFAPAPEPSQAAGLGLGALGLAGLALTARRRQRLA